MKRSLNILCVLVILVLSYSVVEYLFIDGHVDAFVDGFNAGYESARNGELDSETEAMDMKTVSLIPNNYTYFKDSIYNTVSQSYVPAHNVRMHVGFKGNEYPLQGMVETLSFLIVLIAKIAAFVWFIKLIIAINKGEIFSWKNIRRLRWLGVMLILAFVFSAIPSISSYYAIKELFALENYRLTGSDLLSSLNLVLGLVALIVAQVFAIGLRMQEEQELTI